MYQFRFILILFCFVYRTKSTGLKEEFTWSFINYAWPENTTECVGKTDDNQNKGDFVFPSYSEAPKRGYFSFRNRLGVNEETPEYVLENNIPMGVTRYKNRLFITVPRRRVGIPSTLSYVDLNCPARHNVPLIPYPSWEINSLTSPRPEDPTDVNTPFVSVYRTTVDACDRLWFVDMGTLEYPTGRQQIQQFALVVIDLKTDKVIRRFPFSQSDLNPLSTLPSVTVDVTKDTCEDAFAYIPDLVNYKMMVYSWKENTAWRVAHNFFFLDSLQGDLSIGGKNFTWNDGIFSVALSKIRPDGFRTAYFHPMVGTKEFAVDTSILKDRNLATRSYHDSGFQIVGERGQRGQTADHELHEPTQVLIMNEVHKNGVFCWNVQKPLTPQNQGLIQQDPQKMIYPSDLNIDQEDNIWVMTNSMPIFIYGTLNYDEINFRVWTNSVKNAIAGTVCATR